MSVRIPRPLNRVLDSAARHQRWFTSLLTVGLFVLVAGAVWWSPVAAAALGGLLVVYSAATWAWLRIVSLREQVRQRDYDLAAAHAEIRRLRQGDPSAPTAQLRPIGDRCDDT